MKTLRFKVKLFTKFDEFVDECFFEVYTHDELQVKANMFLESNHKADYVRVYREVTYYDFVDVYWK